ncbi:MAG: hypothetical protein IMF11_17375 [Proteobacteria bacterium]|nr:hypothetical protein [Pseudomonadota bacterium]
MKKIIGMLIGIGLMALAIAWSPDPDAGAIVLFLGGALVFVGNVERIVN